MRTTEEIKQEFVKKLIKYALDKEEKSNVGRDGKPRDRSKEISVTDICSWDTYCPRQTYYNKVAKRPPLPEALVRFQVGHSVHEFPLWDEEESNGNEQSFELDGLRCRMDEINFKEGIIVDKKSVPSLPRSAKPYVTKQLNIYRVIAEDNKERPTKIHQLFVLNISSVNGEIQCLDVPLWTKQETYAFINGITNAIKYHVDNKIAPNAMYGSKGWVCEKCQYADLCMRDKSQDIEEPEEEKKGKKVSVIINKR